MYQSGLPDYVLFHLIYGTKWVEFKTATGSLQDNQIARFNQMRRYGVGVYVITSVEEYELLMGPSNLGEYISKQLHKKRGI